MSQGSLPSAKASTLRGVAMVDGWERDGSPRENVFLRVRHGSNAGISRDLASDEDLAGLGAKLRARAGRTRKRPTLNPCPKLGGRLEG